VRRVVEAYGELPEQVGEWWLPEPAYDGPGPLVVLVHGGFWKPGYDRHLEDEVAALLAARGRAVWNVDYRSAAAGWPATLADVAAATDFVAGRAAEHAIDLGRVAVVGHSAGGHLALWLASRHALPAEAPGAGPLVRPALVVAQAPVADLTLGHRTDLGDGAVAKLIGGTPEQHPQRYAAASPVVLVDGQSPPAVLVHGDADDTVPVEQSEAYAAAARAVGRPTDLRVLPRVGHMEHVDAGSQAVAVLLDALDRQL
jgi:acetyl esterase/lipase